MFTGLVRFKADAAYDCCDHAAIEWKAEGSRRDPLIEKAKCFDPNLEGPSFP
jgi:hypothetical protein